MSKRPPLKKQLPAVKKKPLRTQTKLINKTKLATPSTDITATVSAVPPAPPTHPSYERIAYVLQGGGALGSYQVGVCRALIEQELYPNWLVGISIGAINASIIAGNPPNECIDKLMGFWNKIATVIPFDCGSSNEQLRNFYNELGATSALLYGQPGFFIPRVINPYFIKNKRTDQISFYDTSMLRSTLEQFIDFDRINAGLVNLYLGAVRIRSGELIYFNNINHRIGPEHIMASGALPPGFPAVEVDGELYWDGGVYSNTPIAVALNAQPPLNTLCFTVNCFNGKGYLPTDLDQVRQREKDIRYSSHAHHFVNLFTEQQTLRNAIAYLGKQLPEPMKADPEVEKILALGSPKRISIVRFVYNAKSTEHSSKDYNFVKSALEEHMEVGYSDALMAIEQKIWTQCPTDYGATVHRFPPEG